MFSDVDFSDVKHKKWRTGYYDIELDLANYTGTNGVVEAAWVSDYFYTDRRVK